MENRLIGKVIVVAGAGGIGSGLAQRYAREGARVVVADIDHAAAKSATDNINAAGGRAIATELDGADEASIKAVVDLATSVFGGLDGFHANYASFLDDGANDDVLNLSIGVYDDVMGVNARGFLLCTRHAVPRMIERGGGSMIYTSSGAAHMGLAAKVAYSMSKAAGHALMRHVAVRFGAQGIRANTIAPGVITHPRFEAVMDPRTVEYMKASIPVKRLGTATDIASLGALLMSDEGSFITGQVLSVDGGGSMRP